MFSVALSHRLDGHAPYLCKLYVCIVRLANARTARRIGRLSSQRHLGCTNNTGRCTHPHIHTVCGRVDMGMWVSVCERECVRESVCEREEDREGRGVGRQIEQYT
jgi:hypothetical protein